MKQFSILITAFLLLFFLVAGMTAHAQTSSSTDNHTAREEAEGKEIWEKLQTKKLGCKDLTDGQYGSLGEYFMGQMMGTSHEAMNTMMEQIMGKEGEEQMHIVTGKRLSGCDANAQIPSNGIGFMPMMWMMRGGGSPMIGTGWNNMTGWSGFGAFGSWLITLTWFVWLIVGILAAIWLWKQINKKQ